MTKQDDAEGRPSGWEAAGALLARAAELIATKRSWTKGQLARDKHSHPVSPTSERAVRFCVGGALLRATAEQFDFRVRVASEGESVTFVPPEPLTIACQRLGEAMARLLLPAGCVTLRQEGGQALPVFHHPAGQKGRKKEIVEETTWPTLVQSLNDAKGIGHVHVLASIQAARLSLAAAHLGDPSFDFEGWLRGAQKEDS